MNRLRIKVQKSLWLTLAAEPGYEQTALAILMGQLASDRQHAHVMKALGLGASLGGSKQSREKNGEVVCSVQLRWVSTNNGKCTEVCDWLAPIVFQASREGTLATLEVALREADK